MIDIKKTRRSRAVVQLICEKLQITDKELDAFITKGTVKPIKAVK
jgi:hypothetical protein